MLLSVATAKKEHTHMRKLISITVVILVVCFLAADLAFDSAEKILTGYADLWDFLILIVYVCLLVYLAARIERRNRS